MAQELSRSEFYSHLCHQFAGVTLGLPLKLSGPSFHLKNGSDDTCILIGIVRRISEIREIHRPLLIPSKSAAEGWMDAESGFRLSGTGCQLQDVLRGVM